ncbi:androglobin-like [Vespula squamosa]|uniref:Androglobin-like n=1 Tax=Vespula squamosa TaxID=30214 RepID=A0ABD2A479_VESSQ
MNISVKSRRLTDVDLKDYFNENSIIPWTEWKDAELNNEIWSTPQNGEDGLFFDTESVPMPRSLVPYEWIRAHSLKDLTEPLTVFTITKEYPDLIKRNKHLLHSEFIRCFISSLINLQYCGQNGLEVSGESNNFIWNGREEKWKGWMHVYSNNKAGHGVSHRPIINPNGKYIVRLYFLGYWRRIVVDDFIPVDKAGKPLLPTTGNNFEIWPLLLAKALLKIASLTWTQRSEIVDFNPVSCLTGWICLSLNVVHLSPRDKWEFLVKYAEHFEWKQEGTNSENVTLVEEDEKKSKKKGKRIQRRVKGLQLPDKPRPITLFLDLEDMKEVTPETVPGLSPCWSHLVHVVQSRDLPLDPKDIKEPLPKWKEYRWINWAIDRGLLDPVEYFVPIRYLKIVSSLREYKNDVFLKKNLHSFSRNKFLEETINNLEVKTLEKDVKEETIDDISFWCDFNKMASYVKVVQLFYKPEYFGYTLRMSDSFLLNDQKNMNSLLKKQKKDSKKGSKKSAPSDVVHDDSIEFMNTYAWPRTMKSSRNEPLYLFCDSVEEKFLLINFSTMEERLFSNIVLNEGETSESVLIRSSSEDSSYLIIERHSWFFRPTESRALISILTSGTKSSVLELEPGRHLLRIYCRSESRCFISILSDTIFYVGDRFTIQSLMNTESLRTDILVKHISNCLAKAFFSFGSKDYSSNLKTFYQSYMPDLTNVSKKKDRAIFKQIHEYFIEELLNAIKKIFPSEKLSEILFSLRVFFLNPTIGFEHNKIPSILCIFKDNEMSPLTHNDSNESISEMIWINYDQAATIIQAFFKRVIVKQYKQRHNSNHKDHSKIFANLLTIVEYFDHSKGESLASILLRNIIRREKKFEEAYPCSKDFQYVLQIQECKGTLSNVKPDQWIPITRLIVNAQKNETIFGTIQLFINLPSYNLRLFNNETGREMWRLINNVAPSNYKYTTVGYTLFAYGWCDNNQRSEDTEWILHFVTIKGQPMFYQLADEEPISLNTKIPVLTIEETFQIYIPNSLNLISKWIVNIVRDSVLSFKLTTSNKLIQMKLRIIDEKNNVLLDIDGGFILCVPVIYLKLDKETVDMENPRTTYYIEAFVLDDSWPLTEAEWSLVLEAKTGKKNDAPRTKVSNIKIQKSDIIRTKRISKQPSTEQHINSPFWKLQTIIDANSGVQIIHDRRRERDIASWKESCLKDDPERFQRGKGLRVTFLDTYSIRSISSINLEEEISVEMNERMGRRKVRESKIYERLSLTENIITKFLKYPRSRSFELPVLDLSEYEKIEEKVSRVRTSVEKKILTEHRHAEVPEFFLTYDNFLQRLEDRSFEQVRKYKRLWDDHAKNVSQRRIQLDEAYEIRQAYISSIKSIDTPKKWTSLLSNKTEDIFIICDPVKLITVLRSSRVIQLYTCSRLIFFEEKKKKRKGITMMGPFFVIKCQRKGR